MNDTNRATSVSLTWVPGVKDPARSLSHYTMASTRGYATLRRAEKETPEVLHSAVTEHLRPEPLAV